MTLRPNDYDRSGDIIPDSVREETQGERTERALAIIDRLRTDRHINNKEQGTLRRAILLPERPQGKWIKAYVDKREFWFCKKCEYPLFNEPKTNFCPNCGASMKGGAE